MNISKLLEMQKKLENRIVGEKGLEGQDLLDKKILSLQVELGELANEWRGFKYWKINNKPRTFALNPEGVCEKCKGQPVFYSDDKTKNERFCEACDGAGVHFHNPMLEEYVDCLHFILSIGLEIGIKDELEEVKITELPITQTLIDMNIGAGVLMYRHQPIKRNYVRLFNQIIYLGEKLGFTWEQIEQAYYEKNKVNFKRQVNGY